MLYQPEARVVVMLRHTCRGTLCSETGFSGDLIGLLGNQTRREGVHRGAAGVRTCPLRCKLKVDAISQCSSHLCVIEPPLSDSVRLSRASLTCKICG